MAVSIAWGTKIINVPQSYLTNIIGTLYELDTEQFRLDLKDLEDDPEGMPFADTHKHATEVTVAGVTYARFVEIINGYAIEFEDGQYSVRLIGSNNNFFDVANGILIQNQVQVIPGNSAGLIKVIASGGVTEEDKADIAEAVWEDPKAELLHGIEGGRWKLESNQMLFYREDNLTEIARFNLFDSAGNPTMENVYERQRVPDDSWKYPFSLMINVGSISSGSLTDTVSDDGVHLVIDEETGAPGFDFVVLFTRVQLSDLEVRLNGFYDGNPAHNSKARLLNWLTCMWVDMTAATRDFPSQAVDSQYNLPFPISPADYVSSEGHVACKVWHPSNGSSGHTFNINQLMLEAV
jgi:hypothetical protein